MKPLNLLLLIFLLTVFSACLGEDKEKEQPGANITVGDHLPGFVIEMNDGSQLSSASLKGKVSVIILFTVTCPNCQRQFPETEKLYAKYKDNPNFVMLGISREQGDAQVSAYWQQEGLQMPYSAQESRYIYSLFARSSVPRIYISDTEGIVRALFIEKPTFSAEQLSEVIEGLLKPS